MTMNSHNNFSSNSNKTIAQQLMADFLSKPAYEILCSAVEGGSTLESIIKCSYQHKSYIVKNFNTLQEANNEIYWTRHASQLEVGPHLFHADPDKKYMIIEFVEGDWLIPSLANKPEMLKQIALKLSLFHNSLASGVLPISDIFSRIDTKYNKLESSGSLKKIFKDSFEYVSYLIRRLNKFKMELVPCHNDLNPGNIFQNNDRVTIIDWADAAISDPYYDIAAFFVLNIIEEKNEQFFFEHYRNKFLATSLRQEYVYLCKQVVYFEFALNLLLGVQARNKELLGLQTIPHVYEIGYYLTCLAHRSVTIDEQFLYAMALASLSKIIALS